MDVGETIIDFFLCIQYIVTFIAPQRVFTNVKNTIIATTINNRLSLSSNIFCNTVSVKIVISKIIIRSWLFPFIF